jgi:hypothetical protein
MRLGQQLKTKSRRYPKQAAIPGDAGFKRGYPRLRGIAI